LLTTGRLLVRSSLGIEWVAFRASRSGRRGPSSAVAVPYTGSPPRESRR